MNKRILLGIDTDISPSTQLALHAVSALMEQAGFRASLVNERSIMIDTFVIYELQAG